MRRIRVRAEHGERYAAMLRSAGYSARWLGEGTASSSLMSGCEDPCCCQQHESAYVPAAWGSIETDASGCTAHKIWDASRLIRSE